MPTQPSLRAGRLIFESQLPSAARKTHWLEMTFVTELNKAEALKKERAYRA